MPGDLDCPTVEQLVADLRVVRERGLVRLRDADLHALAGFVRHAGAAPDPRGLEALIRVGVARLGGDLEAAAKATFGLDDGGRDRPAQDRRRAAALVYGVSVERFRKHHERIVLEQVAEELLRLGPPATTRLNGAGHQDASGYRALSARVADMELRLVIRTGPIELVSDVDVVVVPTNTYLELPQIYKSSVAAAVRRSAAIRERDGRMTQDVVAAELGEWLRVNGRPGLPVAPGTVVATSPGQLARQGVRRLYHTAVVSPRPGTNDYDVEPTAIAAGVRAVLARAQAERAAYSPPLTSIGFPLIGAGRGGLDAATSVAWLWQALVPGLRETGPWDIHFITRRAAEADTIMTTLVSAGIVDGESRLA